MIHHGEALAWLRSLPDGYADALVTDPPYSSGGAFRGDRAADPSQKYEQTGIKHHLTGKPTEVMRWLCGFVPEGGLVLDPFAGSGTTGVAALQEGLRFAGCAESPSSTTTRHLHPYPFSGGNGRSVRPREAASAAISPTCASVASSAARAAGEDHSPIVVLIMSPGVTRRRHR